MSYIRVSLFVLLMFAWFGGALYIFQDSILLREGDSIERSQYIVKSRPIGQYGWLSLARQLREEGQILSSQAAVAAAVPLAWNRKFYLKMAFQEYLASRRFNDLAPIARRLSEIDPSNLYTIFFVTRQYYGFAGYLENILPGAETKSLRSREFYYDLLFDYALRERDVEALGGILKAMPDTDRKLLKASDVLHKLAQRLRGVDGGYPLISQIAGNAPWGQSFFNKEVTIGFEENNPIGSLCWHFAVHPNSLLSKSVDTLELITSKISDLKPHTARCYIPLQLKRPSTMNLRGEWSNSGASQESNVALYVRTLGTENERQVYSSNHLIKRGDWPLQPFSIDFTADRFTQGMYIDIVFPKSVSSITTSRFSISSFKLLCNRGCSSEKLEIDTAALRGE